eukprot:Colp12_sorted_trinity150504_noHs@29147
MSASIDSAQFRQAKAFLLQNSSKSNANLYDHLSDVLLKVLEERPENAIDIFESISQEVKSAKFQPEPVGEVNPKIKELEQSQLQLANVQVKLFAAHAEEEDAENTPVVNDGNLPDLMSSYHYFEQAEVGLGREETYAIMLALKKLLESRPLASVRFWGKIFGLESNYIIAEAEVKQGEEDDTAEQFADEELASEEAPEGAVETEEAAGSADAADAGLPVPNHQPAPVIPREIGTGANKYIYYVCSFPGGSWTKLPAVTPAQIQASRHVTKFFTGRLDAKVVSYPPFPGNEASYLRAQIARISSSTHISPLGHFTFEEEEDEEGNEEARDTYIVNQEFEGLEPEQLADATMSNWVHHVQYLLPQGRTTWFNPVVKKPEDEEGDEEAGDDDHDEPEEENQQESGPGLLTPCSEDAELADGLPAWTARICSTLAPRYSPVIVRSNRWPGAYAFAFDKKFENIYIGWGQKYLPQGYSPPAPKVPQSEFEAVSMVTEAEDPTVEEEKAASKSKEEQEVANESEPDDEGSGEED